jgi:diketogulonate reductase-like aldo/keto reductase
MSLDESRLTAGGERLVHTREAAVGIPVLGFGTWLISLEEAESAVASALEAGYRHIDTAQAYGNEAGVGRALAASGVPRSEVFLTTKFDPNQHDPREELERSIERLEVERVDLYLVHWPLKGPTRAWPGMVRALESGLTRAIGVSNFDATELESLCARSDSQPVVNQIQLSPFHHRKALLDACERTGVAVEAYSPLTHGQELGHPVLGSIAERHNKTPAQVLLRWGVQKGFSVLPKSVNPVRIAENANIFDFELDPSEMRALDDLDRTGGTGRAHEEKWWTFRARLRDRLARLTAD